jgi:hypothetical protein
VTKHVLASSTSAQPLLTPHRHSSVLTSSAHPRAQAPSKCCSGCSPSSHPCSVLVLALTIVGYLPLTYTCRLMNLSTVRDALPEPYLGPSEPENMLSLRNGAQSLSSASILSFIGLSRLITLGLQGLLVLLHAHAVKKKRAHTKIPAFSTPIITTI